SRRGPGHVGSRWRQVSGDDSVQGHGRRAVPPREEWCTGPEVPGRGAPGGRHMRVFPAIDLRGGACVQLVGGEPDAEKIRLPDPMEVARRWKDDGFQGMHLADLDAALGTGSNADGIAAILEETTLEVEVGGGVRDAEAVQRLLDLGASRVIVGTRALEDPRWLEEMAFKFPGKLILAADTRGPQIVTRRW